MSNSLQDGPSIQCALICMETPLDHAGTAATLPRIFGKPAIFHQVKQLQRLGISDIIIAVDAIPAELPQLVEQLSQDCSVIHLMRPNVDNSAIGFQSPFLLVSQDLWVDDNLLREALRWNTNSIGIVEEEPANSLFERIDLNRRWSGLAVLDSSFLQYSKDMPEGWSLASFLLRHGLQSGATEVALGQRFITDGLLKRISNPDDLESLFGPALSSTKQSGVLESLVSRWSYRLVPPVAQKQGLMTAFGWAPAISSMVSAGMAYFGYLVSAVATMILALCLEEFRHQLRAIEYRDTSTDYASQFIRALAFATMCILLWRSGEYYLDAIFLTAMATGLIMMAMMSPDAELSGLLSPLSMAVLLSLGLIFSSLLLFAKLGILFAIGLNLWVGWRSKRNHGQLNSN